jgi:hypothetical protein
METDEKLPMRDTKKDGDATQTILSDLGVRLEAYLDEWRRELGIPSDLQTTTGRDKACSGTSEWKRRRQ